MCGRLTSTTPADALARWLGATPTGTDLGPRYNVAPTTEVYAVARVGDERRLGTLRWGLVPPWAPDPGVGSKMINARAETLLDRPAYREPFARRRCLVPVDGFYEWERRGRPRQPWYVRHRDGEPLALAGLWSAWRPGPASPGPALRTCAIVTTDANGTLAPIHHRMPVAIPASAWEAWLDPSRAPADLLPLLVPAPDELLVATPVGPRVGDVANDDQGLTESVEPVAPALW